MTAYTSNTYGPPTSGYFFIGDTIVDAAGAVWSVVKSGVAVPPGQIVSGMAVFDPLTAGVAVGTAGTGVTAAEYGDGRQHTTVLTLGAGCVLPAIAGGASLGVGTQIYTFPAGAQLVLASKFDVGVTQTQGNINANTPVIGLGHVVASGAVSVLSGTATFQSINVGKAATNCTGTHTVQSAAPTVTPFTYITETGGVKAVFLNAAAAWSASGDAAAKLDGTVVLHWIHLG
jgi:hypothetical protein